MADVYRAADTIHKTRVALKVPKSDDNVSNDDFLREVQIATRLVHPNILTVQDASFIDDHFVIAMELGTESLADRIERRISGAYAMLIAEQALAVLAHAHSKKIIHCDIKPENFILFPGNRLKLADFGFAKVSLRTLKASGSGTIDYIAPEQAMGRPKFQSDVFSLGLVLYRLFSGKLPEWPFKWPMVGHDRLQNAFRTNLRRFYVKRFNLIWPIVTKRRRKCTRHFGAYNVRPSVRQVLVSRRRNCRVALTRVPPGGVCNGANSNVSFELRWIPATSVDAAMDLLLKICRVARGVVSVTPLAEPRPACPRFVHAANAALNQIGRIARGAMAPASKSKRSGAIPISAIPANARVNAAGNR